MRNHQNQKFHNLCVESSKVCVQNHQDNYFLINVACKSDANMIIWLHVYCNFCQFRVVEDDLTLFCHVYIMLCHVSDPNFEGGGGG